jgi:uncharacterized C2H2 Zn-finger protein
MAVIRGTKDRKNFAVVTGTKDPANFPSAGETRKLRCRRCGEIAVQMADGKGGFQTQCPNCGAVYKATRLD